MNLLTAESMRIAWRRMERAAQIARDSTCYRSQCGSTIYSKTGKLIGAGYNSPPLDQVMSSCQKDSLPPDFISDRTCCIHAEQRAIMDALRRHPDDLPGSSIYFIRLGKDLSWQHAGDPYCTICSKMALDVGIAFFLLYRKEGIVSYPMEEYNRLSFASIRHRGATT